MSLTKFNESVTNHQSLPDKPSLTSEQLKALFDKASVDIKTYINSTLTSEIDTKLSELTTKINSVYPVGAIYMSVNSTNPSTLFGGTWVAWGQGRVPIGVGTGTDANNTSKTFSIEETNGEYNHTLTVQQIPSHGHSVSIPSSGSCTITSSGKHNHTVYIKNDVVKNGNARRIGTSGDYDDTRASSVLNNQGEHTHTVPNHTHTVNQSNAGGGQAHNNLQPYITCYMWKRTA